MSTVPTIDPYEETLKEYEDIREKVKEKAKQMRFVNFALSPLNIEGEHLRYLVRYEYKGKEYAVDDPALAEADPSDLAHVLPANISNVPNAGLMELIHYYTCKMVQNQQSLCLVDRERSEVKEKLKRVRRTAEQAKLGKINPDTEKVYTEKQRKDAAENDAVVMSLTSQLGELDGLYSIATTAVKNLEAVVSSLNRQRMYRSDTGQFGPPPPSRPNRNVGPVVPPRGRRE